MSHNSTDHLFASAYLKSKEKYLLSKERVEKMLGSKTPDDALRVLSELNYGSDSGAITVAGLETLLSRELERTYRMVTSLAPEQEYFAVFMYPNDYHNIKVLLKAEFLETSAGELLIDAGSIPLEQLVTLVQNRDYFSMRREMSHGIQYAIDSYSTVYDPQVIDLILDKACYKDILNALSGVEDEFITGYFALKIDSINLKSFVRTKAMNKSRDFFSSAFIDGGSIPVKVFTGGYENTLEQFADKLVIYGLQTLLLESIAITNNASKFTSLEKLCDNLLIEYARAAKHISVGTPPLVNYIVAKENEIKTIRIIMAGKLTNISPELIRERISSTYV